MFRIFHARIKKFERGQSFVELSLVVVFLMILVAGIIEFGFMLNNYLNMIDASREAVRYSSNADPFKLGCTDHTDPDCVDTNFYTVTFELTEEILSPVVLDPANGDDILVSFFSIGDGFFKRFPNDNQGLSRNTLQVTKLSDAEIKSRLDSGAPPTGAVLVEIFYHYPQVLKLPIFTAFVQDPMPVYVYALMPLAAAEPVPTPTP